MTGRKKKPGEPVKKTPPVKKNELSGSSAARKTKEEPSPDARPAVPVNPPLPPAGNNLLTAIFNAITESSLLLTEDGTVVAANDLTARRLGLNAKEELIGRNVYDLLPPDVAARRKEEVRKVFSTGTEIRFEDGRFGRDFLNSISPVRDGSGIVTHVAIFGIDITDRKKIEAALRSSGTILQEIMDEAHTQLVYLDRDFNFVAVNKSYAATCRLSPEEMVGKNHFALYPHPENETIFRRVRDTGEPVSFHDRPFVFPDQPERGITYWDWTLSPVRDARGTVTGLVFSLAETTERKRAEEALRENEERLKLAIQATQDGIWDWNMETDEVFYSLRWKTMLGYEASEIEPHVRAWKRLLHPDDLPKALQVVEEVRNGNRHYETEFRMRHKDGHYVDILSRGFPIRREPGGPVIRMVGTHFDLTDRKRAEKELREARDWLSFTLNSAGAGTWDWDFPSGVLTWSPEFFTLFGLPADSPASFDTWLSVLHPDDRDDAMATVEQSITDHKPLWNEYRVILPGAKVLWIGASGTTTYDTTGKPLRMSGICIDITERKRIEVALKESEERFRQLFTQMPGAGAVYRPVDDGEDFLICDLNAAAEAAEHVQRRDLIGRRVTEVFPGIWDMHLLDVFRRVWKTGQPEFLPAVLYRDARDPGSWRENWVYRLPDGDIVVLYEDVTPRKQSEEMLRQSEERFRLFFAREPNYCYMISPDGCILDLNDAALRVLGYAKKEEVVGKPLLTTVYAPGSREKAKEMFLLWKKTGRVDDTELTISAGDGGERTVLLNVSSVLGPDGTLLYSVSIQTDITERKRAEEALAKTNARLSEVLVSIRDDFYVLDRGWKFVYANRQFTSRIGKEPGDFVGNVIWEMFPKHLGTVYEENLRAAMERREVRRFDLPGRYTDAWYSMAVFPSEEGVTVLGTEITSRKEAEDALRESEEKYRNLVERSLQGLTILQDGRPVFANNAMLEIGGFSREEYLALGPEEMLATLHPGDRERISRVMAGRLEGGDPPAENEFRIQRKDGKVRWVLTRGSRILFQGRPAIQIVYIDITDRKRAEDSLRRAGLYTRSLIEASLDPLVTISPDGKITDVNTATEKVTGISRGHLIGTDFSEYFTEPDKARAGYKKVFEEGFVRDYPLGIRNRAGTITPVLYNASVYRDDTGAIAGVFAAARDITKQKQSEETLKESEQKYRDLVTTLNEGVWYVGPEKQTLHVNPRMAGMLGYAVEEMIGKRIDQFVDPASIPEVLRNIERRKRGFTDRYEVNFIRKDGRCLRGLITASPLLDGNGTFLGSVAGIMDITERRHYEDVLSLSNSIFSIANRHDEVTPMLDEVVRLIRNYTGCEAVGIRLLDAAGNIPYTAQEGFATSFYDRESPLNIRTDECMCIYVIRGEVNPALPVATPRGSFYCNGTSKFLAGVSDEDKGRTRNACNQVGFESVALVAIRRGETILGLIHLADHRENRVPVGMVEILEDISQALGSSVQRIKAEAEIRKSLQEKELLLREIHHRVKNNLAGIISLIGLQLGQSSDPATVSQMKDLESRIRSMALVHESLYKTHNIAEIPFQAYCIDLMNHLSQSFSNRPEIRWNIDMGDITLPLDTAIPCGMIVSEITTNALKYAFPPGFSPADRGQDHCEISMRMRWDGPGVVMTIADNGVGLPGGDRNSGTLGIHLIRLLAQNQLQGNLDICTDHGTEYTIRFNPRPREAGP